jgi:hypothetical protein
VRGFWPLSNEVQKRGNKIRYGGKLIPIASRGIPSSRPWDFNGLDGFMTNIHIHKMRYD